MIYLIISALLLALMVVVYRLTLSRTTFHGFNRYVLLCSLALAAIVPLAHFQGVGRKTAGTLAYMINEITVYADGTTSTVSDSASQLESSLSIGFILTMVYLAGMIVCLLRIVIGVLSSEIICHGRSRTLSDGSRLVITERNYAPFSWRNYIVISRKDYEANGAMIITHEQAHISHHHSFDLILAQVFCAVQWFNPAAWMLKRSLLEVHEYEADASVLEHGFDGRRYQICLVRAALQGSFATTTNNFANCSTKKRIVMMNRHSTNPWARLRVLLMLPAVAFATVVASACKSDTNSSENLVLEPQDETTVIKATPVKTSEEEVAIQMTTGGKADDVFMVVEEMPEYPGGTEALLNFLRENINYPEYCKENKIQGRVIVTFVVEKDGSIVEAEVVKSVNEELDAEALRVISSMPKWKPGKQRGENVRVKYTVPVNFKL